MKYVTYILIGASVFVSCGETQQAEDSLISNPVQNANTDSTSNIETKSKTELIKLRADSFVQAILDTNAVSWTFQSSDNDFPKDFRIFKSDGLFKAHAYSRKGYPQLTKPNSYHHFVLFLLEYQNTEQAKSSFEQFLSDTENYNPNHYGSGKENERIRQLFILSKHGGLVCWKDRFVMNLVETCGGGSDKFWIEREKQFLGFIFDKSDSGATVLNADCGKMKYEKQTLQ